MLHICGRKVKVHTRTKSQTVNICSPRNIHGEYDYVGGASLANCVVMGRIAGRQAALEKGKTRRSAAAKG